MLHAISHKKTVLYKRYLGHRDENEKRVHEEDEITSLVFSPLSFMSAAAVGEFFSSVLCQTNQSQSGFFPAVEDCCKTAFQFWPRRSSIEPDMVVNFEWPDGQRRILLVEFKWKSPLSGYDQLHKQWEQYLSAEERKDALHVFVAPEVSAGYGALEIKDVWRGKLVLLRWLDIQRALLDKNRFENNELRVWAQVVSVVLDRLGIRNFYGFDRLPKFNMPNYEEFLFWHGFKGFRHLVKVYSSTEHAAPLFFESQ